MTLFLELFSQILEEKKSQALRKQSQSIGQVHNQF